MASALITEEATAAIADGYHFPFSDDPDGYRNTICAWWVDQGHEVHLKPAELSSFKGARQMSSSDVLGQGRTALVTGASRGIGTLIVREIAKEGGHVVLTGRSATELRAVTSELAAAGADVCYLPADLTQPGAAGSLVETIERQRGGIDLLVNNAGGDALREFHTMTVDENLRTLQLNLVAPVALSHAVLGGCCAAAGAIS